MWRVLVVITILCLTQFVHAEMDVNISGEGYFGGVSHQKPSSLRNQTAFNLDRLYLNFDFQADDVRQVKVVLDGGQYRTTNGTQGPFQTITKYFYYQQNKFICSTCYLRLGQIPTPWLSNIYEKWGYEFLGVTHDYGLSMSERYGYDVPADLGIGLGGQIGSFADWAVVAINGEGYQAEETGANKDYGFRLSLYPFRESDGWLKYFFLDLYALRGRYENYDIDLSEKSRNQGAIGFHHPKRFTFYMEQFRGNDPADKVNGVKAHKVDLLARAGEMSESRGTSYVLRLNLSAIWGENWEKWELFGRNEKFSPDLLADDTSIQYKVGGVAYEFNENLNMAFAQTLTHYDAKHGSGDDQQSILMQLDIKF